MTDDSASSRGLGGRIGGRLAGYLVQANLASKSQSTPLHRQVGAQILNDFFAGTGAELVNTMGPLFTTLAQHPDTPDSVRPLFHFLSRGQGEMASFIGGAITSSTVSQGLGAFLSNELQFVTGRIIATNPNLPIPVSDAASAQARGFTSFIDNRYEANQQGIDNDKFDLLVELARNRPDPSVILDLVNRGQMSMDFAVAQLLRLGYDTGDAGFILETRRQLLTPAALADMVVRGIMTEPDAAAIAGQSGLAAEDFHALVLDNGEPPGIQDLLFLNRRGVIDLATLEHGIRQSRIRDEWIPAVKALTHQPMSTADAVEAAVQGHLSLTDSQTIAEQNGLQPDHWQVLYDTAGNPPGVQDMVSMYHRGVLTLPELVQGIKESRLKDKYIQKTIDAGITLPPERSIVSLVSKGGLTDAEGADLLFRRGYPADIVNALIAEAHVTKTQAQRDLTASQIVALYEDGALSQADALSLLDGIGYDAEIAQWEITLADLRKVKTANDAAVSRVHSLYVGYKIDQQTALSTLDGLRIASGERDTLMTLWNIERDISTKQLTLTEITNAHKKALIDDQGFYDRLRGIGYAADDAVLLVELQGIDPSTLNVS